MFMLESFFLSRPRKNKYERTVNNMTLYLTTVFKHKGKKFPIQSMTKNRHSKNWIAFMASISNFATHEMEIVNNN